MPYGLNEAFREPSTMFRPDGDCVLMLTRRGNARLNHSQCDRLLDIFQEAGEPVLFNDLHDAFLAIGGIARVSSFRSAA